MLSARSGSSYSAKAVQKEHARSGKDVLPSPDRLLTDRGSYIAYLESQLERVSAACLTVTSFDERLEQAVSAIRCLEEKTLNLARLVAVTQQFAEQQEVAQRESAAEIQRRLRSVEARLEELEEPARAAAWEAKLRAVSAQVDAKLAEMGATSEAGLAEAAGRLQASLEEGCHAAHLALEKRMGEAAGRLTEVERKVRAVDERAAKLDVTEATVADLAGRVGGMEDSLAHLAQSDAGMKGSLGSLQTAVAQLKTAVIAQELRPPLGDAAASSADCLQWLERAREALKREVGDIQEQPVQLAAGLNSAVAVAAAAPASPQKQLAAQVLSGLQCSMQQEVGKELQALRLADQLLESVTSQFKRSPPRGTSGSGGGSSGAAPSSTAAPVASGKEAAAAGATGGAGGGDAGWTIAAVPAAGAGAGAPPPGATQVTYPPAPSSQQAVTAAADGALAQLQQLAGGEQQLAQAAAALAATGGSPTGTGSSSLRSTFGQMQSMLQSVCQLLQEGGQAPPRRPNEAAYQAAAARYLSRSSTLAQSRRSGSPESSGTLKRPWLPGGGGKLGGSASGAGAAAAGPAAAAAASSSLSFGGAGGGIGGGSRAREALRESVLGQASLEQRRKRLQQLYAELKGQ